MMGALRGSWFLGNNIQFWARRCLQGDGRLAACSYPRRFPDSLAFPFPFYEWQQYCASVCIFLPEPFIKNKNKITTTENFPGAVWSQWVPEAGKTSWQPSPRAALRAFKGLFVWWSAVWKGGQLVEVVWRGLGRAPGLGAFQTLSFPSLKCQDLIHGKLGELAALAEDFIEPAVCRSHVNAGSSAKKGGGPPEQ